MSLRDLQLQISQAIWQRQAYDDKLGIKGGEKAFAIYRNNIFVSLINTLRNLYPQTALLCGDDFSNKARNFVESFAPSEAHLLHYGKEFPNVISADNGMLGVVAVYENLRNLSYGADRGEVLTAEAFLQYEESVRLDLDVRLSHSVFVMEPLPFILAQALCEESVNHEVLSQAENKLADASILLTRHNDRVLSLPITLAEAEFLHATSKGEFASGLIEFIETYEEAQSRLGEFFALSVFRLG